jgi:hypothetical protein
MIAAIKKAGGHPKYTEYPDEEHNIWDKVSRTPGLLLRNEVNIVSNIE